MFFPAAARLVHKPHPACNLRKTGNMIFAISPFHCTLTYYIAIKNKNIDKTWLDHYDIKLFPCEDGHHLEGNIFNPDGVDIGIV